MADEALTRIATYPRQIEKLAAQGDCEAIAREVRLALRLRGKSRAK